jgi:hypothetical protein
VKAVNMVLNAAGLALDGRVQVKKKRIVTITYRLNADKVAEMMERVKLRLRGGFCEPSNAHARAALAACTLPMYGHLINEASHRALEPADTSSPMELRFKAALEALLGIPFVKARPAWLTNPVTGHPMELDLYNEPLRLAVEYNGAQHYVFPNVFHATEQEHAAQLARDTLKAQLCTAHRVTLISIRSRQALDTELADFDRQWPTPNNMA